MPRGDQRRFEVRVVAPVHEPSAAHDRNGGGRMVCVFGQAVFVGHDDPAGGGDANAHIGAIADTHPPFGVDANPGDAARVAHDFDAVRDRVPDESRGRFALGDGLCRCADGKGNAGGCCDDQSPAPPDRRTEEAHPTFSWIRTGEGAFLTGMFDALWYTPLTHTVRGRAKSHNLSPVSRRAQAYW